jgi:hypothetical protein
MLEPVGEKPRIYIFHVRRADGRSLILHPFRVPRRIPGQLEESGIVGRYGAEPRVEALTSFRNELYANVDAAVSAWRADARFIPRFLLSTAVFLVSYFVFSFLVRDPIPIVDELIISSGASVLLYLFLKRRDPTSDPAARKRAALTAIVDAIRFTESPFVLKVEGILHGHEGEDLTGLAEKIDAPEGTDLGGEEREEALQFLALLEETLRIPARLRRAGRGGRQGADGRAAAKDLPLFVTYRRIKRTVASMDRRP